MDPSAPLGPAPPGVVPDFHSIAPLQKTIIAVFSTTFGMATIALILRLYTGVFLLKRLGWDALLIVLSWGASLSFFILMIKAFPNGFGRDYWSVTLGQFQAYLDDLLGLALAYFWPPTLAKLSLLVMYYRIDKKMVFPYCIHIVAVLTVLPVCIYTGLLAGPCSPTGGNLQCVNNIIVVAAIINIFTDIVLIVMPLHMTMHLNMSRRQKITLGCLLTLGSFVVVFSIIRSAFIHSFTTNPNVTYAQAFTAIWSCLELNFGITCNCLAVLQPFLRAHLPRLAKMIMGSSNSASGTGRGRVASVGSRLNARRSWLRPDKGSHSYALHSVDKASGKSSREWKRCNDDDDDNNSNGGRGSPGARSM